MDVSKEHKQTLMEGTSMKATVGMKVTGYSGSCIGVFYI